MSSVALDHAYRAAHGTPSIAQVVLPALLLPMATVSRPVNGSHVGLVLVGVVLLLLGGIRQRRYGRAAQAFLRQHDPDAAWLDARR